MSVTNIVSQIEKRQAGERPVVPPIEDFYGAAFYEICCEYLERPDLRVAGKKYFMTRSFTDAQIEQCMKEWRTDYEPMTTFLASVDSYYRNATRAQNDHRQVEEQAVALYRALPVEGLTEDEKLFIYSYSGDIQDALSEAGLKPTKKAQLLMLSNPQVRECKLHIDAMLFSGNVASGHEVMSVVSDILRDETLSPKDRMAAGTLLAKAQGMLTEKIIIEKVEKEKEVPYEPNWDDAIVIEG